MCVCVCVCVVVAAMCVVVGYSAIEAQNEDRRSGWIGLATLAFQHASLTKCLPSAVALVRGVEKAYGVIHVPADGTARRDVDVGWQGVLRRLQCRGS